MNARSHVFELSVHSRQIEEVVSGIFHSLLLHRTHGKFHYKQEDSYQVGTLGFVDVDCEFIDFTYVRVDSAVLDSNVRREVIAFRDALTATNPKEYGQISLEFFQRKHSRLLWPECIPWEVWTVKLDLTNDVADVCREHVGDIMAEKIFYIADIMNRHEYVPKIPSQSEVDLVFDTSYDVVQPYLHRGDSDLMSMLGDREIASTAGLCDIEILSKHVLKITHQINGPSSSSVSTIMRKFFSFAR